MAGAVDDVDLVELRGLLHDLGHGLATLSLLTETVRADDSLSEDTRERVFAVDRETKRLPATVRGAVVPRTRGPAPPMDVRELLGQIVSLASLAGPTSVVLMPGPPVRLAVEESLLWRMVTNLVDNAVRAAGVNGRVAVSVRPAPGGTVVEVCDDGPGFGAATGGWGSLGLGIVRRLAQECGCEFALRAREGARGTAARLTF